MNPIDQRPDNLETGLAESQRILLGCSNCNARISLTFGWLTRYKRLYCHACPQILDTEPVLITGTGKVDLNSDALDFQFRGQPKHVRLRLRTSLVVHGTLAQPVIGLEAGRSVAQAGAGVALGVLLTPLAAIAAFIDIGRAQDADCAALIATHGG